MQNGSRDGFRDLNLRKTSLYFIFVAKTKTMKCNREMTKMNRISQGCINEMKHYSMYVFVDEREM